MSLELRQTVCPMDCPDACSLEVELREGHVAAIRGDYRNPLTGGFICSKVRRFGRRLDGPDRVLYPLRRTGDKGSGLFERVSWDEAAAEIAERFSTIRDRFGSEAILPYYYGGSNGLLTQGLVDAHFFRRLGASRLARTICAASTTLAATALYGKMPGTAFQDYAEARFVLLWGANPTHSNIHLVPYLKEARRRGAKIALVDPRRILSKDTVDWCLQPYPGTDLAVALAMIHHLNRQKLADLDFLKCHATGWQQLAEYAAHFPPARAAQISGVPEADIAATAEAYAEASPAALRCGWGVERNRNGLAAVAAILALPAVAGKFGVRGGGYTLSNTGAHRVDDAAQAGAAEAGARIINMNHLGRALAGEFDPPVQALFVYNANPVATTPDHNRIVAGLQREDLFTVVLDQVLTDTAVYADLVLPATTFLEHQEVVKSYGSYTIQLGEPVIPPRGEARSNAEAFQLLGRAMGWHDGLFAEDSATLLRRAVLAINGAAGTPSLEVLRSEKIVPVFAGGKRPVQFVDVFPATPDGKAHLYPPELGEEPYLFRELAAGDDYPLALISPASNRMISSTFGEFNLGRAVLSMHPSDAAPRGLRAGASVRAFNELGEVHCGLELDDRLRPGVVSLPKGIWRRSTQNHAASTSLVPDSLTPVSDGACFNDARVQVEALQRPLRGVREPVAH